MLENNKIITLVREVILEGTSEEITQRGFQYVDELVRTALEIKKNNFKEIYIHGFGLTRTSLNGKNKTQIIVTFEADGIFKDDFLESIPYQEVEIRINDLPKQFQQVKDES